MATKRTYGDRCGVAHALDMLGERWSLLVVRDLLLGPKRFTDLQAGLSGAGPNVLTQRLGDLQKVGVVRRRRLPAPAGSWVYELTEYGQELEPIVVALGLWGTRSPVVRPEGVMGADSTMLSLRSVVDPRAAGGHAVGLEIRLERDVFAVDVTTEPRVRVTRGQHPAPDAVVDTDIETLNALMTPEMDVESAVAQGLLRLSGDVELAVALLGSMRPVAAPTAS